MLGALGLIASRVGLSAIPAYLLAGLLLGPNEPHALSLVHPSEVTHLLAELGLIFLLFFLGLEFTTGRLARSRRHALVAGAVIEWVAVPDTSACIGKTLAECGFRAPTGITVIAILREPEPVSGARPDDVVQRGDTLVTVGKHGQYRAFRALLAGSS